MAQATQAARNVDGIALPPAGTYEIDRGHTGVEFVARHMLSRVRGRFTDFEGTIEIAERPEDSKVRVEIKAASIQTNQDQRDEHLRSGDFLLANEHPTLVFESTAFRPTGDASFELDGNLTIKGTTRPVTLHGEYLGFGPDPMGNKVVTFSAKTTIAREDWDMTWNVAVETGGFLVGKKVDIELDIEAHKVG